MAKEIITKKQWGASCSISRDLPVRALKARNAKAYGNALGQRPVSLAEGRRLSACHAQAGVFLLCKNRDRPTNEVTKPSSVIFRMRLGMRPRSRRPPPPVALRQPQVGAAPFAQERKLRPGATAERRRAGRSPPAYSSSKRKLRNANKQKPQFSMVFTVVP